AVSVSSGAKRRFLSGLGYLVGGPVAALPPGHQRHRLPQREGRRREHRRRPGWARRRSEPSRTLVLVNGLAAQAGPIEESREEASVYRRRPHWQSARAQSGQLGRGAQTAVSLLARAYQPGLLQ